MSIFDRKMPHCHPTLPLLPLPPPHSHYCHCHCHYATATTPLPATLPLRHYCHCHCQTATIATATATLPKSHCHPHYYCHPRCHTHPRRVDLVLPRVRLGVPQLGVQGGALGGVQRGQLRRGEWQWQGGSGVIRQRRSVRFEWWWLGNGSSSIGKVTVV
jgi:hypothetical protein